MLPVRCFTCNKTIGQLEEKYRQSIAENKPAIAFFTEYRIERYCCRRMFLGYVPDLFDNLLKYSRPIQVPKEDSLESTCKDDVDSLEISTLSIEEPEKKGKYEKKEKSSKKKR